jgi:hypothetical protein
MRAARASHASMMRDARRLSSGAQARRECNSSRRGYSVSSAHAL